ncbi:MAG: hypothetical protein ACI395_07160 [Candidatus Cryptobacteroides sp.]
MTEATTQKSQPSADCIYLQGNEEVAAFRLTENIHQDIRKSDKAGSSRRRLKSNAAATCWL